MNQIKEILDNVAPEVLSVAVINLDNVAKNYNIVCDTLAPGKEAAAVVKANAYGFGAVQVSKKLYAKGCRKFFVATISEGIEIRQVIPDDANIYVLSGVFKGTEKLLNDNKLTPVLNCSEQSELWIDYAQKIGERLHASVHVDTGMSRNGFMGDNDYSK